MANTSLLSAFERMWQHIITIVNSKADKSHEHTDTLSDINSLQNSVSALEAKTQYSVLPITEDEYNALGTYDPYTIYIIEV